MKQKLRMFAIHQIATSLQRTNNLNPRTIWYLALDESNRMKSTYFTMHPGKNPPLQNGCWLKYVFFLKGTGFTSSTFPIQPYFSQNQPATMTLNTGSPWTLWWTLNPKIEHEETPIHDAIIGYNKYVNYMDEGVGIQYLKHKGACTHEKIHWKSQIEDNLLILPWMHTNFCLQCNLVASIPLVITNLWYLLQLFGHF